MSRVEIPPPHNPDNPHAPVDSINNNTFFVLGQKLGILAVYSAPEFFSKTLQ